MRRILRYLIVALVVAGAAVLAWRKLSGGAAPLSARVRTAPVAKGPVVAKITATGTLSALVTVQVGSQVSGRIAELHADFNSQVKKGQLIARIDPQLFAAAVEQARANLVAAEGNLARAQAQSADADRQAERQKALAERQLIAQADFETAQANATAARAAVQAARGAVEQARASLNQARINLAYTNILSPIDGVVISRDVDVGQTVAASLQAPTLFTIAEDLTRMQVDTSVAEADIGKLQPGMEATFTVDAWPQAPFKGRIRQIRNSPQTVQNVVTYDAVIDVENPELKLKPGMTATVTVVWAQVEDALKVPNAALRFRPSPDLLAAGGERPEDGGERLRRAAQGNDTPRGDRTNQADLPGPGAARGGTGRQVWILRGERLESVPVRTGITDGSFTEITDGALKVGDLVVTEIVTADTGTRPTGSPMTPRMGGGGRRM